MKLFEPESEMQLLPYDGEAVYYSSFLDADKAADYLQSLLHTIVWKNDEALIFGKHIQTRRQVAWYGDRPFEYTYSGITRTALFWTDELLALKNKISASTGETFNSCLLNLYPSGKEGMGWHSDAEKDLRKNGTIASLSLGAERKFSFRHKQTRESVSLKLAPGSLLLMKGSTQTHWLHRLPPSSRIHSLRINLTFRTVIIR